MSSIKVSVIVPTYNREKFIRRCIDSIINQTMPKDEYEVIIIDDCSKDSTYTILQEYKSAYPELIKLFRLPENSGGASIPRNKGIDEAQGTYICFVDSDDSVSFDILENAYNFAIANDSGYMVCKVSQRHSYLNKNIGKVNLMKDNLIAPLGGLAKFIKLKVLNDFKIRFNPKYRSGEDQLFNLQCICNFDTKSILADKEYAFTYYSDIDNDNHLSVGGYPYEIAIELASDCLNTILNSRKLSNEEKMKTCSLIFRKQILYNVLGGWLKSIDKNNKKHKENFKLLAEFVNRELPEESDKYCDKNLFYTLVALRENNFEKLTIPAHSLKNINNFKKYLELLNNISKNYMVIISVRDTPGRFINEEIASEIMNLGFEKSLYNQSRHSYIGIIDEGKLIYEDLSQKQEAVYLVMKYFGTALRVISKSFTQGDWSEINIDGKEYSVNSRGLNIVVYNKYTKTLIDSVGFDMWNKISHGIRNKKVSVIVPTYNAEKFVHKCIDSMINQTMPKDEYELIIVDDCSKDFTYNILQKYQAKYPNLIKIFKLQENSGGGATPRNKGVEEAHGEYVFFVDSDDYIVNDTLENAYNLGTENNSDYIAVRLLNHGGQLFQRGNIPNADRNLLLGQLAPFKFIRRNIIIDNKIRFNPKYRYGDDHLFLIQAMCYCKVLSVLADKAYYIYTQLVDENVNESSITLTKMNFELSAELFEDIFKMIMTSGDLLSIEERHRLCVRHFNLRFFKEENFTKQNIENKLKFEFLSKIINSSFPIEADKNVWPQYRFFLVCMRENNYEKLVIPYHLKDENNFEKYIENLKLIKSGYMIVISVKDTSAKNITEEIADKIMDLGLKIRLYNKHLKGYIGVIDCDKLIYEDMSQQQEPLYLMMENAGISLKIKSQSYRQGNLSEINIDGKECSINKRGLNIVVYDKFKKMVMDSVCFDMWNKVSNGTRK